MLKFIKPNSFIDIYIQHGDKQAVSSNRRSNEGVEDITIEELDGKGLPLMGEFYEMPCQDRKILGSLEVVIISSMQDTKTVKDFLPLIRVNAIISKEELFNMKHSSA